MANQAVYCCSEVLDDTNGKLDQTVDRALLDYYRLPPELFTSIIENANVALGCDGFFQFGTRNICYGRAESGTARTVAGASQFDAKKHVRLNGPNVRLPFNFGEIVDNLRLERYRKNTTSIKEALSETESVQRLYSVVRQCLPATLRRQLQKAYFRDWQHLKFPAWPVDSTVETLHEALLCSLMEIGGLKKLPFIWFWPEGASNCLMVTHDVETLAGRNFTSALMDIDDSYGFKASFEVVPEKRYEVPDEYVHQIRNRGFEFNVHDLNHDGQLYTNRREFVRRAAKINDYVRKFGARGFRSGSMYRNQEWFDLFEFSYDMSVPNVAHLDPMHGGCCTVMPYFVGRILELPVTTIQDYSLFYILNDYSIDLWKKQLTLIRNKSGLISFITHPDYLMERRARSVYEALLEYLRQVITTEKMWAALPRELDSWWRARSQMKLVWHGNRWEIVGAGSERARLAYAVLRESKIAYEVAGD